MSWEEYWVGTIVIQTEWKGHGALFEISNPYGGGHNHFAVSVNNYYLGYFYRSVENTMDCLMYSLFYSDDLLIILHLINEKNGENLTFGNFHLNVPSHRR